MVDREANITALYYFQGQSPASGPSTEQVILEVCKEEGLQQVIWISQTFPEAELAAHYEPIYREGVQRYGEPVHDRRPQVLIWPSGKILLAVRTIESGRKRLIMISTGDKYETCSAEHEASSGHPASRHTAVLLD